MQFYQDSLNIEDLQSNQIEKLFGNNDFAVQDFKKVDFEPVIKPQKEVDLDSSIFFDALPQINQTQKTENMSFLSSVGNFLNSPTGSSLVNFGLGQAQQALAPRQAQNIPFNTTVAGNVPSVQYSASSAAFGVQPTAQNTTSPQKTNYLYYILGGLAVLVLGFFLIKKRKR